MKMRNRPADAGAGRRGFILLGALCMLAACTQTVEPPPTPVPPPAPPGVAALAQRLGSAPSNAVVRLQANGAPVGLAEIGTTYTAASGRTCRRLSARIENERVQAAVCQIAGSWRFAEPLTHSAAADRLMSGQVSASG